MAEAKNTTADKSAKAKFDFTNLNTLAVVSLASAVTGFGAAAAVITGHVSLAQIKKSQESGRGLAIAGVVAGYTVIGLWILSTVGFVVLTIWGVRHGVMPMNRFGFDGEGMRGGPFQMDLNPNGGTQGQD
jgi:hypothetical protein